MANEWDAIVVGGGPSGSTAAMYFARAGKKTLFLDMTEFPRDKVCGDAQGRRAANIMKELGIYEGYAKLEGQPIYGLTLSSPNGTLLDIDVEDRKNPSPGFVHRRMVFDNYLFQNAKQMVSEKGEFKIAKVSRAIVENGIVKGVVGTDKDGKEQEFRAKIVLAADGANSVLAKQFNLNVNPHEHFIVALRAYYHNVEGMTDRIELHLLKSLIPGYFWIFPLPNKEANVGLGMIVEDMYKAKINLQDVLLKEIKENPLFKDRFKNATLENPPGIRGWSLPVASFHRKCFLPGILFLGDSASLIDPLSGEGIGNAMISGKIAAEVAVQGIEKNDVSEKFLERYDKLLWDVIGEEIKTNYRVQVIAKKMPFLIDKLIVRATKDEKFRNKIKELIPYGGKRQGLVTDDFLEDLKKYQLPA